MSRCPLLIVVVTISQTRHLNDVLSQSLFVIPSLLPERDFGNFSIRRQILRSIAVVAANELSRSNVTHFECAFLEGEIVPVGVVRMEVVLVAVRESLAP